MSSHPPDAKEFGEHLKSLLLCCCSPLSAAVDTLVKAYRFKLPLDVSGKSNPGYQVFVEYARELGVAVHEVEVPTKGEYAPYTWLSDRSTPNLRAWIPDMRNREADFHVLLPFLMRYHLAELRKHEPDFSAPQVRNLYVALLWAESFGLLQKSLSARILRDLLDWERAPYLTANRYAGLLIDEIKTAHGKVRALSDMAQLYLGFCGGGEGWELVKGKEIWNHPFNQFSRQLAGAMAVGSSSGGVKIPILVNQYTWDIESLAVITKNAWALNRFAPQGKPEAAAKVRECLLLRLQGKSEEEILQKLGFSDNDEYYNWQVGVHIDTDPKRYGDPYDAWLRACEFCQIPPSADLIKRLLEPSGSDGEGQADGASDAGTAGPQNVPQKEKVSDTAPEISESESRQRAGAFRHGPDYRSVVSVDGQTFSLTERQAGVIQLLHHAFLNKTPEVSQARVIEEVYGEVQEDRLKKLFANNDAWGALIQPGRRKGLVRLRTERSRRNSAL